MRWRWRRTRASSCRAAYSSRRRMARMLVAVARFPDPLEAHIACGRLRAEGIDAHVADAHMGLANWEWRLAVGGTRVLVDERSEERRVGKEGRSRWSR